ncbi:MAG: M15 family metallopeptidase [Treponema sp.]|nr:M15 family metallopeptidase [Treponema sp.]
MLYIFIRRKILPCCLFFLGLSLVFGAGKTQKTNAEGTAGEAPVPGAGALTENGPDQNPGDFAAPPFDTDSRRRAGQVIKALAAAYPDRIVRTEFRRGDWALKLRSTPITVLDVLAKNDEGTWFYYAGGRLLPEELLDRAEDYDPQPFYNYPPEMPPWREPSPGEAARFREMAGRRREHPPKRSQHFYDALWRAGTRDESYERVKSMRFLGRTVMIHYAILEELSLVEELILTRAKTDPELRAWVNSISTLEGWAWRSIADTQSRSFHAYGAAIDILPGSLGGKETYWLWTARARPDWWMVPYDKRFHPPDAAIKAFESRGFIWGGKWVFYDTMHFEYRPEILILGGPLAE